MLRGKAVEGALRFQVLSRGSSVIGRPRLFAPSRLCALVPHARGAALGSWQAIGCGARSFAAAAPRDGPTAGEGKNNAADGGAVHDPFKDVPEELKDLAKDFKPDLEGYKAYVKQKQEEGSALHIALAEPEPWYKRVSQSPELGFVLLMSIIASLSWNLVRRKKDHVEWDNDRKMREAALMERITVLEQSLSSIQEQREKSTAVTAAQGASQTLAATAPAPKAGGRIVL